ncbi:AsmA-like C-terminal region-containing protein [Lignipirellula cremea]|uniref:Uncharacterized protein n=1 Tax=Lignipirellula cremea TaxID=2528010 RepID=A0A518DV45_9BACT|nr:AsmA-like C-terminal region-containing protein [Lignipirellula cremea]QDU95710.1 hypothetical protein Pla8534_35270 [Lignipirellula cremea]
MDADSPSRTFFQTLSQRVGTCVRGLLKLTAVLAAVAMVAYIYALSQTDEAIRSHLQSELDTHYTLQGLQVTVASAKFYKGRGVAVRGVVLKERFGERKGQEIARFDEVYFACDASLERFITDPPPLLGTSVRGMRIRAELAADGSVNAARLFPLPNLRPDSNDHPPVKIEDAVLEIVDTSLCPPRMLTVRNIEARIAAECIPGGDPANPRFRYQIKGSAAGDFVQTVQVEGTIEPDSRAWKLQGFAQRLVLGDELYEHAPQKLTDALAVLKPLRGELDLNFAVSGQLPDPAAPPSSHAPAASSPAGFPLGKLGRIVFQVDGDLTKAQVHHSRLPYPLTNLTAGLHLDNQGLKIKNLSARSGLGLLELSGERVGWAESSPLQLTGRVQRLSLDEQLTQALPPELLDVWHSYAPAGVANVDFSIQSRGGEWTPNLLVELVDVSFAYFRFPYRVTNAAGKVRLTGDRLTIAVRGLAGGQLVRIDGDFLNPGPDFTGRLQVELEGAAPLDEAIIANLDAGPRALVRRLSPRGMITVSGEFGRNEPNEESQYKRLTLGLQDCSIRFDGFPYPIEGITGTVEVDNDRVILKQLQGRNDSAFIVCNGQWEPGDDGGLQLAIAATDVPLDDDLRLALTPEARQAWSDLRARGTLDHLQVDVSLKSGDEKGVQLKVRGQKWKRPEGALADSISMEPTWLPYRLDSVTGVVTVDNGVVTLEKFAAQHEDATASLNARSLPLPDGGRRLEVDSLIIDRLPVDHELLTAMPENLGAALGQLQIQGALGVRGSLRLDTPGQEGGGARSSWDLTLGLENGSLTCGESFEHIHGGAKLVGAQIDGQVQCRGELGIDSLIYRDMQLTQVNGPLWIDNGRILFGAWAEPANQARAPRRVQAQFSGGQLAGDGQVLLTPERPFTMNLQLSDADLATIALEVGRPRQMSGQMFAALELNGNHLGAPSLRGRGAFRLRDANIYELPVVLALLKLLRIREPDQTAFDTGDVDFQIEGEHLYFSRINFSGDAITLKGNGEMNLRREINMNFYTMVGRDDVWVPVISPALGLASQQLLLITATGTLDNPIVKRKAFPGLEETLKEIFAEDGGLRPLPPLKSAERMLPQLPFFNR